MTEQPSGPYLARLCPACRSVGNALLGLACSPHRHPDRDGDRCESSRGSDNGTLDENSGRIGIEPVPPDKEGRRRIERHAAHVCPCQAELGLITEAPSGPLCRRPGRGQHYEQDDQDLAPEDLGGGQRDAFPKTAMAIAVASRRDAIVPMVS